MAALATLDDVVRASGGERSGANAPVTTVWLMEPEKLATAGSTAEVTGQGSAVMLRAPGAGNGDGEVGGGVVNGRPSVKKTPVKVLLAVGVGHTVVTTVVTSVTTMTWVSGAGQSAADARQVVRE